MIRYIENERLRIGVKEFGGELTSVVSKTTESEFLWQGRSDIWSGQSPVLFPIIGRLIDDEYTLNNKKYSMPKHGFARKLPWRVASEAPTSISLILSENDETLKVYPFCFDLIITYSLKDNTLTVTHEVVNKNSFVMYFSLGAHPAFNCEIGDRLIFSENETLDTMKIDLETALLLPETCPILKNEREIVLTEDIFNEDALIFKSVKSKSVTLVSDALKRKIRFSPTDTPYLGIWAKPGAPYVCIEPWYGLCDSTDVRVDFSEKAGIIALPAKDKFKFSWSAEFTE